MTAQEWVSLAPSGGSLEPGNQQVVTVTVDRLKLGSGANQGTVDFTSQGGSASVPVLATGSSFGTLSASPTTLDFGTRNTRSTVEIRRVGGAGALDWTVEASDSWIDPKTTSGSLLIGESRTIFVEVVRESLDPGAYQGTLTFRWGGGGAAAVVVAMRVADEPVLGLSEETLQVGVQESFTFSVLNAGSGTLNWDITETAAWLQLAPTSGSTSSVPRAITGTIDRTGMTAGTYETAVHVESDGGSRDLPLVMEVPLPVAEITSGPAEGSTLSTDSATFEYRARQAYGTVTYAVRLDGGEWTAWGSQTRVAYADLEESSLSGPHLVQVRVRADAGESAAQSRTFEVNAVEGPALRLAPKAVSTRTGQTVAVNLVAEEVQDVLAARAVVSFDAARLELVGVTANAEFLEASGGTVVMPNPEIDNAGGRVDLAVGVAGGTRAGISGTGVLARLDFRVRRAGVVTLAVSTGSSLRDLDNRSIPLQTAGCRLTAE
ncbi:MAG: cohesin domain-containing protein [Candidatus Latescibacterota bacterium]